MTTLFHRIAGAAVALAVALFLAACSWGTVGEERLPLLSIEVLDVGQGDAILIGDGEIFRLIDTGPPSTGLSSRLRAKGITRLEQLFLTHHHLDHIGSAVEVLRDLEVKRLTVSADGEVNPHWEEVVREAALSGVPIDTVWRGDWIDWGVEDGGEIGFRVLWPYRGGRFGGNHASLVLQLVTPVARALFTGDLEREGEEELVGWEGKRLASELLKVGHHGSRTGTTLDFLGMVRPLRAAVSAGRRNDYGHPHPEPVADLLLVLGDSTRIHRTDREGDLRFEIDGGGLLAPGDTIKEGLVRW